MPGRIEWVSSSEWDFYPFGSFHCVYYKVFLCLLNILSVFAVILLGLEYKKVYSIA